MIEPTAADGPVQLLTDGQGWHIAYHAWRTVCATKDIDCARRALEYHLSQKPGTAVVGAWTEIPATLSEIPH